MASWWADGNLRGYSLAFNTTNVVADAGPGLTIGALKLASPGTVDTQGVTRFQYEVSGGDPNFISRLDAVARLRFTSGEVSTATAASKYLGATIMIIPASEFPNKIPTPTEIWAIRTSPLAHVYNAASPGTANTNYEIPLAGNLPAPNTKVWVLVFPSTFTPAQVGLNNGATPLGFSIDGSGRAISVWSNRTPLAPKITSPGSESVYGAGASFDLTYVGQDPDRFSGGKSAGYTDEAGVQVQYRPKPTTAVPDPAWLDLPITTLDTEPAIGGGWYIARSINNKPLSEANSGAYYLWANKTMKVRCGGPIDIRKPGVGILRAGQWQVRVRTFDYGHPYPRWKKPLNDETGDTTPDTYPSINTSPWSTAVTVTVSDQVLAPVPLSPINAVAIADGTPITLRWRYRNTYVPPYAQIQRTIQMREVGADVWTTIVSGNGADSEYALDSPPPVVPSTPNEYLANGNFEAPGIDGWLSTSAAVPALTNAGPPFPRTGNGSLLLSDTSTINPLVYKFINLLGSDTYFSVSGWYNRGNADQILVSVFFVDDANTQLSTYVKSARSQDGYRNIILRDMPRPVGATKMLVQITIIKDDTSEQIKNTRFDDLSILGADHPPSDPIPTYNPVTLVPSTEYEWRVQVTDASFTTSAWSQPARFWYVPAGASGEVRPVPENTIEGATLGCGTHRVEVYRRGGRERVAELTDLSYVDWSRVRDDISTSKIIISGWGLDCGDLLKNLQTWAYEVVIFRDNGYSVDRVWEGPITLLTYESDKVTIQAKDVMAYMYRRIIKQAVDDTGKSLTAGRTVVARALQVLQNAFAPDDPNVLAYIQAIVGEDDAKQYRRLPAYSRTAFEEVDDMAANAGLDYVAVGRAILLWGTKHRIGTLPEFRDEDLGSSPIVSEYGMSAANVYSISDGNGVHGEADRLNDDGLDPIYGLIEVLSSSWASDSEAETGTYTQAGIETVKESFAKSAEKSIASKYPPPVVVRVPDNTTLNPGTVISIQQLVPGVVIPLRSTSTLREVRANQKLDSIKVTETSMKDGGTETIQVTMSPFSREDSATEEGEGA